MALVARIQAHKEDNWFYFELAKDCEVAELCVKTTSLLFKIPWSTHAIELEVYDEPKRGALEFMVTDGLLVEKTKKVLDRLDGWPELYEIPEDEDDRNYGWIEIGSTLGLDAAVEELVGLDVPFWVKAYPL